MTSWGNIYIFTCQSELKLIVTEINIKVLENVLKKSVKYSCFSFSGTVTRKEVHDNLVDAQNKHA